MSNARVRTAVRKFELAVESHRMKLLDAAVELVKACSPGAEHAFKRNRNPKHDDDDNEAPTNDAGCEDADVKIGADGYEATSEDLGGAADDLKDALEIKRSGLFELETAADRAFIADEDDGKSSTSTKPIKKKKKRKRSVLELHRDSLRASSSEDMQPIGDETEVKPSEPTDTESGEVDEDRSHIRPSFVRKRIQPLF